MRFFDRRLESVWEKVQQRERLDRSDGLALFETEDLLGLGRMADHAKSEREGERVYFVLNRYISPTNVCVLSCSFCGFARKKGEAGAFEYTVEDIVGMVSDEVREVHIVGGHHPDWPFEYYERVIAGLHAARPAVQIKAFTAAEIDYFWRRWKIEPPEALARLKAAGLQTMPGGGAEIFSPRVARLLRYTGKADGDRWCEIHGIAHSLGIRTNATMDTTSVALHFGADDVNGTLEDERVQHMAGAETPAGLAREQLFRIIRDAGKIPVERDALYNVVRVWDREGVAV